MKILGATINLAIIAIATLSCQTQTAYGVTFTTIHSFTQYDGLNGWNSQAALAQDSNGYLYGTTSGGVGEAMGTVFGISTDGSWFETLVSFNLYNGGFLGGSYIAGLIQGKDGYLYGTTLNGGAGLAGEVYQETGSALNVLYSFSGGGNGQQPYAGLVQGADGNFYGTTTAAGSFTFLDPNGIGYGTIFKISATGSLNTLHFFSGDDGSDPRGNLIQGRDGALYGTTSGGGASGFGTVFKITTNGDFNTLYSFTGGGDGGSPLGGLVQGTDDSFYGTTCYRGAYTSSDLTGNGYGTVFKITGNGSLTTLASFNNTNGANPNSTLVLGSDGNFYGTTSNGLYGEVFLGDAFYYPNFGTIFQITPTGVITSLVSFDVNDGYETDNVIHADGAEPNGLILANDGNLCGTCQNGGAYYGGIVFRVSLPKAATGSLKATISPTAAVTAGAQWQVDGGSWQHSGTTVTNLSAGSHTLGFGTVNGWITPANQDVSVSANSTTTASGVYVVAPPLASLQFTIAPATAIAAGALWQVDGGAFESSGATVEGLSVGNHTVNFSSVGGWTTPASQTVSVRSKQTTKAKGTYAFSAKGVYNGLFSVSTGVAEETAGMLNALTIGSLGTYSGKLLTDGKTCSFTGGFGATGQASNHISRTASLGGPLTLEMTMNWNDSPPNITGTVSGANGGPWMANLNAELATNSLGSAEYTILVSPGTPPGYGYILITNHAGIAILTGALADGTPFSQTVPVSGGGGLPVYCSLYGNTGLLLGLVSLEGPSPGGDLAWIKKPAHTAIYPNGFANMVSLQGSRWSTPSPHLAAINLPLAKLDISGGNLSLPLSFNAGVSNNNALVKLPGSPTNSLTGSINPKTGLLTVTFGDGIGKATVVGHGAVLQNTNVAAGFFLGKTNAGSILLQPMN